MSLLRDGTVMRKFRSRNRLNDPGDEDLSTRERATIEDVTQTIEGLNATLAFTFKAVQGEEVQRARPANTRSGFTILCAEDNFVNQRVLSKMLGNFGQDYVMTENGQRAVEVYKSNPGHFPCIFMDLAMPVMDGFEATRLIRVFEDSQPPDHRRALIVGLTAHHGLIPNTSMFSRSSYGGFDLLLSKPFRMIELYELFLGGPETNIVMLYGSLTEEEKSGYPRLMEKNALLGDDPRSNAIKVELERRLASEFAVGEDTRRYVSNVFIKIIVKVVEASEDGKSLRTEN